MRRIGAFAFLLLLLAPAAQAVGPETRFYAPSETDCLPPDDVRGPARPEVRPGAVDPSATHLALPITDTPGAVVIWDEAVDSPENGTARLRHSAACGGEGRDQPRILGSPFDVSGAQRTPSEP